MISIGFPCLMIIFEMSVFSYTVGSTYKRKRNEKVGLWYGKEKTVGKDNASFGKR